MVPHRLTSWNISDVCILAVEKKRKTQILKSPPFPTPKHIKEGKKKEVNWILLRRRETGKFECPEPPMKWSTGPGLRFAPVLSGRVWEGLCCRDCITLYHMLNHMLNLHLSSEAENPCHSLFSKNPRPPLPKRAKSLVDRVTKLPCRS